MSRYDPRLRREQVAANGGPDQARRLLQCCVCRDILKGSAFTYYQFKRAARTQRRCRMCTMRKRESLRVDGLSKFGGVEEDVTLVKAVKAGNFAQVMFDLERGKRLYERDRDNGRTALHEACSLGNVEMVELLLDSGANPDERAWAARETPLHYAMHVDSSVVVEMLCWFGANPQLANRYFQTALHYAKSPDAARAVLHFMEDVRKVDKFGHSASMAAKAAGRLDVRDAIEEVGLVSVIQEQREAARDEKNANAARKHAEAMRAQKLAHDEEQSKVSKAVEEYHKWRTGAAVKHKRKVFEKAESHAGVRSWRQKREEKLREKKKQLRSQEQAKKAMIDKLEREKARGYQSRRQRLAGTAKGPKLLTTHTRSSSKWAKYSKKGTSWAPPAATGTRASGLLRSPIGRRPAADAVPTAAELLARPRRS